MVLENEFAKFKLLHEKYVQGEYKERWVDLTLTHSDIVRQIAIKIANKLEADYEIKVNRDELEAGCLLHDIGVYLCYFEDFNPSKDLPPYIHHGFIGYEILLKEGFSKRIARFALTHTGTGFTIEDIIRENLPYPKEDNIPVSLEEEILCYADKFHSKYPSFCNFEDQKAKLTKFGETNGVIMDRFQKKFGIPDIEDLKKKYDKWHTDFDEFFSSLNK